MKKKIALLMACVMAFGVAVGGTLAWLTDSTGEVKNTFTESDIEITLTEDDADKDNDANNNEYKMVPAHIIDKNPKVTVDAASEDCWLFVKITESTTPDLDAYIAYAIADVYDATKNPDGWQIVQDEDTNGVTIIGRKVYKDDATKKFGILGAGEFTDTMGTADTADDFKIAWGADKVGVKPSVTKQMMEEITGAGKTQPTLKFQAAAVQLFKQNSDGDKANTADEFTATDALAKVTWPTT